MYIRDKIKLYSRFNEEGALKMLKKGDVISYGTTGVCKARPRNILPVVVWLFL